jgi:undecaprenyl diphosphate synthase
MANASSLVPDLPRVPLHVGIIMDGNGRWAAQRGMPRIEGHRRGVEAVRRAVRAAGDLGVRYLTLYSFSTENWRRPADEVGELMILLKRFIRHDLADLHAANVKVIVIGERVGLSADLRRLLDDAEGLTRDNTGQVLAVAFNYGAREELTRAARRLAEAVAAGRMTPDQIDAAALSAQLYAPGIPDPDLIIRTSGEQRISNFLLWQAAYSELVFLPVLWPDFDRSHFEQALAEFQRRDRRFGGVTSSGVVRTGS